jgi:hypothetical protein
VQEPERPVRRERPIRHVERPSVPARRSSGHGGGGNCISFGGRRVCE